MVSKGRKYFAFSPVISAMVGMWRNFGNVEEKDTIEFAANSKNLPIGRWCKPPVVQNTLTMLWFRAPLAVYRGFLFVEAASLKTNQGINGAG